MTDSRPSQEIEDVLSTIRRLVADERPQSRRALPREGVRGNAALQTEKEPLLLTESLRVVIPGAPEAVPPEAESPEAESPEAGPTPAVLPDAGLPVTAGGDVASGHDGRDLQALFAVAARNVAQIGEPAPMAEWEEEDPDTVGDVTPLPFVTRRRRTDLAPWPTIPAGERAEQEPAEPPPSDATGLSEAARKPDAGEEAKDGDTAEAVEDLAELARARLRENAAVSVPDRDLLRALVREILLEELSGALGERITRNLRRLARAEANRAVATRDLG